MPAISPPAALRRLALAAAALLLGATGAQAALSRYHAHWSGAASGNTATADAIIFLDDAFLQNPGSNQANPPGPLTFLNSITLVVTGAAAGNGTFTTADFSTGILFNGAALNYAVELVGQPQAGGVWGGNAGAFSLAGATDTAPQSATTFEIATDAGRGDRMRLTSFVPAPPVTLRVGAPVTGAGPGVVVASLAPPATAPDGTLYFHGKIQGPGITAANADCILSYDGFAIRVVLQAGDRFPEGNTKSFGDPILHGDTLHLAAKLVVGTASVTAANDVILLRGNIATGSIRFTLREGTPAGPSGYSIKTFNWLHPVGSDHAGTEGHVVGVTLYNPTTKTSLAAVIGPNDSEPLCIVGGPVVIDGVTKIIKSIAKPTAVAPASYESRVGNDDSVSLLIRTTTGETTIQRYQVVATRGGRG